MAKVDSVDGNKVTLSIGGGMGAAPDGSAPEKPDDNGDSKGGDSNVPEKPDDSGDSNNASENNGSASGVDSYDAVTEYAEDTEVDGESYSSTGTDENAILVSNGATATLKNITVDRTSSDSTGGDNSSFYGGRGSGAYNRWNNLFEKCRYHDKRSRRCRSVCLRGWNCLHCRF